MRYEGIGNLGIFISIECDSNLLQVAAKVTVKVPRLEHDFTKKKNLKDYCFFSLIPPGERAPAAGVVDPRLSRAQKRARLLSRLL